MEGVEEAEGVGVEGGGKEEEGMHTYILLVEGYSIISNIGFCKIDIMSNSNSSGFAFYTLSDESIQAFRENEERYLYR
jgi:hypothetical protein